jgi:hypothetical protein
MSLTSVESNLREAGSQGCREPLANGMRVEILSYILLSCEPCSAWFLPEHRAGQKSVCLLQEGLHLVPIRHD